jgi:hypothetical protein
MSVVRETPDTTGGASEVSSSTRSGTDCGLTAAGSTLGLVGEATELTGSTELVAVPRRLREENAGYAMTRRIACLGNQPSSGALALNLAGSRNA